MELVEADSAVFRVGVLDLLFLEGADESPASACLEDPATEEEERERLCLELLDLNPTTLAATAGRLLEGGGP